MLGLGTYCTSSMLDLLLACYEKTPMFFRVLNKNTGQNIRNNANKEANLQAVAATSSVKPPVVCKDPFITTYIGAPAKNLRLHAINVPTTDFLLL
jgi:hypothetical protein